MKAFFKRRASTQSSPIEDPPAVPFYTLPGSNKSPKPRLSSARVPPPKVRLSMLEDVDTSRKHQSTPVLYISSPIAECAPCADVELQSEPADLSKRFSLLRSDGAQYGGGASRSFTLEGLYEYYEPVSESLPPFKQRRPSAPFPALRTSSAIRADSERRALPRVPASPCPSILESESSSMTVTPSTLSALKPNGFTYDQPPSALATPRPRPIGASSSRPLSHRNSRRLSTGPRTISNFRRGGTGVSSLFGGRVEEIALAKGARARAARSSRASRAAARADLAYFEDEFPLESSERDSGLYVDALEDHSWSDTPRSRPAPPTRRARPKHVRISFVPFRAESPRTSVVEIEPPRRPSCVSFGSDTFGSSRRTRTMSWEKEAPPQGPTDPVVDAPAQRAFDSDPYTFLSALLPPLQTTAPTYPDEDYPSSVSTPSPPLSTRVGRTSRQDSSESDAFSQYDWKRSGSISTVAMDTPPLTSTDAGVETDASGDVIWRMVADLRNKRESSKTVDSLNTLISSDPRDAELPPPPMTAGKNERWPFFKRPSRVVVVDDADPWGGALAAVAPRRLRAARL